MNVLTYAKLAQSAYSDAPTFGIESSASRAVRYQSEDGIVIAIPGTNNITCDLADLDIELERTANMGTVHRGFYSAYQDIGGDLMKELPDVVTGHSLGAAMALIYAADLCLAGKPPKAVLVFEPPRVSIDTTLGEILAKNSVKLLLTWYGEDIVPMVPRILHNWQHPAPLTRIGSSWEEDLLLPIPNVDDHAIANLVNWYTVHPTEI